MARLRWGCSTWCCRPAAQLGPTKQPHVPIVAPAGGRRAAPRARRAVLPNWLPGCCVRRGGVTRTCLGVAPSAGAHLPCYDAVDGVTPGRTVLCCACCSVTELLQGISVPPVRVWRMTCALVRSAVGFRTPGRRVVRQYGGPAATGAHVGRRLGAQLPLPWQGPARHRDGPCGRR